MVVRSRKIWLNPVRKIWLDPERSHKIEEDVVRSYSSEGSSMSRSSNSSSSSMSSSWLTRVIITYTTRSWNLSVLHLIVIRKKSWIMSPEHFAVDKLHLFVTRYCQRGVVTSHYGYESYWHCIVWGRMGWMDLGILYLGVRGWVGLGDVSYFFTLS